MIALSEEYVVQKFYEYNYNVKRNRYNNTYQGGCCICREGKSLNKKRRCFYIPKNNNIFCHNCGWSSTPFTWICEVTGKSTIDVIQDFKDNQEDTWVAEKDEELPVVVKTETLPKDSINLFDTNQLRYYHDNPVITACLDTIKQRRLDIAVNRPDSLYVSLVDTIHKNRLIIPFVNTKGEIEFYQTRTILQENTTKAKYISKINSEKTLFNIDKITSEIKNVFIFEGPIDAFFVRNSVAVAGITERGKTFFTQRQQQQFDTSLRFFDRIWVLDSQWLDTASLRKSEILLQAGESVFIWPEEYGKQFKDINDIVIRYNINQISTAFIEKNTFCGLEGILRLSEIKRYNTHNT
jgi:hypothetical protein